MPVERVALKVGNFECVVLKDATQVYENPASVLFYNAPRAQLQKALQDRKIAIDSWYEYISPYPSLLVKTGMYNVLVDTGIGSAFPPAEGNLLRGLEEMGIAPDQIDFVLITHAHGDHCGGNADRDGRAAFRNARYLMHKAEWEYWTLESTLAQPENEWMAPIVDRQFRPLRDHFDLNKEDVEVVPGIEFIAAAGHTPGHMIVRISADGEQLWYLSDAFLHPIHVEQPDWYATVDVYPEQAAATRHALLAQLAAGQPLIHCFHFPFPGLGTIKAKREAYQWQPI